MKLPPPMDGRKPLEPWPCIYSSEITIIPLGQKSIIHRHHPGGFFVKTGGSSCSQSSQPGQPSQPVTKRRHFQHLPLACWKLLGRVVKKRKLSFFQFFPPCFFQKVGQLCITRRCCFGFCYGNNGVPSFHFQVCLMLVSERKQVSSKFSMKPFNHHPIWTWISSGFQASKKNHPT